MEEVQDPDIAFGIIINQSICPEILYDDDEIKLVRLLEDVYQIVHDSSDEQMQMGVNLIQEEYEDLIGITPWESTQLNEHRFTTTLIVTE